jgi:hypothetical protein
MAAPYFLTSRAGSRATMKGPGKKFPGPFGLAPGEFQSVCYSVGMAARCLYSRHFVLMSTSASASSFAASAGLLRVSIL